MPKNKLTPKQKRFAQEYMIDFNGKQAAIRAGYSPKSAEVQASVLLSNPKVAQFVEKQREKLEKRTEVTQETVVKGLLAEATLKGEGSTHGARVSAWGLLGKYTGGFIDRGELAGKDGAGLQINIVRFSDLKPDDDKSAK